MIWCAVARMLSLLYYLDILGEFRYFPQCLLGSVNCIPKIIVLGQKIKIGSFENLNLMWIQAQAGPNRLQKANKLCEVCTIHPITCSSWQSVCTFNPIRSRGLNSVYVLGGGAQSSRIFKILYHSQIKRFQFQTFRKFSLGSPRMIYNIKDDPVLQVPSQEPSTSSNFLKQYLSP